MGLRWVLGASSNLCRRALPGRAAASQSFMASALPGGGPWQLLPLAPLPRAGPWPGRGDISLGRSGHRHTSWHTHTCLFVHRLIYMPGHGTHVTTLSLPRLASPTLVLFLPLFLVLWPSRSQLCQALPCPSCSPETQPHTLLVFLTFLRAFLIHMLTHVGNFYFSYKLPQRPGSREAWAISFGTGERENMEK